MDWIRGSILEEQAVLVRLEYAEAMLKSGNLRDSNVIEQLQRIKNERAELLQNKSVRKFANQFFPTSAAIPSGQYNPFVNSKEFKKFDLSPQKPGIFMMGEEGRKRQITLTKPFELQIYPVRDLQYLLVMGYHPFYSQKKNADRKDGAILISRETRGWFRTKLEYILAGPLNPVVHYKGR